ncbi:MAG: glycosyltransferase family 39 protein, partial [Anaerolinea sp.]|nr:glycosyltransferase family 39 protein [Anaerolinea sp.]
APLSPPSSAALTPHLLRGLLPFLALLFAAIGQFRLSSSPEAPGSGVRWFLLSGISLFLLLGQWRGRSLPTLPRFHLSAMPKQRWLYLLALSLAFLGQGLVNNTSGGGRPLLAILVWLSAIALAFYALRDLPSFHYFGKLSTGTRSFILHPSSFILFFAALLPRAFNLTTLPFILNGTEASLGLDALHIAQGSLRHPFATGWMSNPTLPLFLMALPLKLLGVSTLSLRLLSPIVGALTVLLTYWFGRRLWNEAVGLAAAVLLAGMHLHVHYSRMALTNVWDPLLALLALGLLALAWQESDPARQRGRWLWVGTAVGFSAYWFTPSHLLPLMFGGLLLWALLFDRVTLWQQGRHMLAALALAFLIALPLLLFYNTYPFLFMERANALGILAGQSDWLNLEAARTGLSQGELFRRQFWQAALAFNGSLDKSPSYRPLASLLSFGPALFFGMGLLLALLSLRQLRYALLLAWVGVTLLFAGALLQEPPQSHRLLIAAPAVALLAALALTTLAQALWANVAQGKDTAVPTAVPTPVPTPVSRHLLMVVLIIAALLAVNDLVFYYGRFPNQNSYADRNTEIAQRMADYLNTLEGDWTAYFYGPPNMYISFPTIPLLVTDFQANVNLFDVPPLPDNITPPPVTANQVHIYLPERQAELLQTQAAYPDGAVAVRSFPGVYANPLFYVYEVRP